MTSASRERLFILPCDHRDILTELWTSSNAQKLGLRDFIILAKDIVLDGLLDAVSNGVDRRFVALLMEEEYGRPVLDRARDEGITRFVPLDNGEVGPFELQYGDDFLAHIADVDPDVVSALISLNPSEGGYTKQLERFAPVVDWQIDSDRKFMLELQVLPNQKVASSPAELARWTGDRRPGLIVEAIGDLLSTGLTPDVWKLQGCSSAGDYERIVQAALQGSKKEIQIVVLGGGANRDQVDNWLIGAASVNGFSGFAVGRSVWARAIEDFAALRISRNEAVKAISEEFGHFVEVFESAKQEAGFKEEKL